MKQDNKNIKCIEDITKTLKKYNRTPQQVRYIFKKVRENSGYQIKNLKKRLPDFLNDDEIRYVIDQTLKEKNKITRVLIPFAINTGLRISEIRNLHIQDIDFSNYQLRVVNGKGGKDREVILPQGMAQLLKTYLNDRKKGHVFVKSDHTPYTIRALQIMIKNVFDKLSLDKKLSAHSLRHTYATLLRRKGVSLDRIQLLMGHTSRETTEIYAHLELAPIKEEVLKLLN